MKQFERELIVRWKSKRVFCAEKDQFKRKKFISSAFQPTNSYDLDPCTAYPYIFSDVYNRYHKMLGKNVTLALGVDDCGFEAYNFCNDNHISSKEIYESYIKTLDNLGVGYEPNKTFYYQMSNIIKFAQETFNSLYNKNIFLKKTMVLSNPDNGRIYNSYEAYKRDGNYYLKSTDELLHFKEDTVLSLNIAPYYTEIKELIKSSDLPINVKESLYQSLGEYQYLIMDFSNLRENIHLNVEIKEPELMAGISFIALNPQFIDVMPYVAYDEQFTVSKYLQNGYSEGVFSGSTVKNPLTGEDICIFISYDFDEAIHLAIPSINEQDKTYSEIFGFEPREIIDENNCMINSDILDSLPREQARFKIMRMFAEEGLGTIKSTFSLTDIVLSHSFPFGVIVPLLLPKRASLYELIEKKHFPIFYNNRERVIISNEETMTQKGDLIGLSFNRAYMKAITKKMIHKLDNELLSLVINDFEGENTYLLRREEAFEEYLLPKIFDIIFNEDNSSDRYIVIDYKNQSNVDVVHNNTLRIAFISDILKENDADAFRLFCLSKDCGPEFENARIKITKYQQFLEQISDIYSQGFSNENDFLDKKMYELSQNISFFLREKNLCDYVSTIINFMFENLLNEKMTEHQALLYLKLLSLLAPFRTQKIFEDIFGQRYFIVYEEWPYSK